MSDPTATEPTNAARDDVLSAAVLVATAFRLLDENGLIETFRRVPATPKENRAQVAQPSP